MDADFWHQRWRENRIAFHEGKPNAMLKRHGHRLSLTAGQRVFLPLCGKALDLTWFAGEGFRVLGAELNRSAVDEVFQRMGVEPHVQQAGKLQLFKADGIEIHVGDIFDLSADSLGDVDAIYDRAALVALPSDMRKACLLYTSPSPRDRG